MCLLNLCIHFRNFVISAQIGNRGTVTEAAGFNAETDAQALREAMKGAGECPPGTIIS